MSSLSLDRLKAAKWASRVTGYRVTASTLAYWEQQGLLRHQQPGHRVPATYRVDDLTRLRLIAELRKAGAPLQRIRKAVEALERLVPELEDRPGAWRLAVLATGDVVQVGGKDLFDLTRRPGQTGWLFLLDAKEYLEEARHALRGPASRRLRREIHQ